MSKKKSVVQVHSSDLGLSTNSASIGGVRREWGGDSCTHTYTHTNANSDANNNANIHIQSYTYSDDNAYTHTNAYTNTNAVDRVEYNKWRSGKLGDHQRK